MTDRLPTIPTSSASIEKVGTERNDAERFSDVSKYAAINTFGLFQYEIKPKLLSKKSAEEFFSDPSLFDPSQITQALRGYIESEWIGDGKNIPDEYRSEIDTLTTRLVNQLKERVHLYFIEKNSKNLNKRVIELNSKMSFF